MIRRFFQIGVIALLFHSLLLRKIIGYYYYSLNPASTAHILYILLLCDTGITLLSANYTRLSSLNYHLFVKQKFPLST